MKKNYFFIVNKFKKKRELCTKFYNTKVFEKREVAYNVFLFASNFISRIMKTFTKSELCGFLAFRSSETKAKRLACKAGFYAGTCDQQSPLL